MEYTPEQAVWNAVLLRYVNDILAAKKPSSDGVLLQYPGMSKSGVLYIQHLEYRKHLRPLVDELYRQSMESVCMCADIDYDYFRGNVEKKLRMLGYYDYSGYVLAGRDLFLYTSLKLTKKKTKSVWHKIVNATQLEMQLL